MSPCIYYLKGRNQKFFATHTPLRCQPALGTVDMYSLYLSLCLFRINKHVTVGHGGLLLLRGSWGSVRSEEPL